MSDLISVSSGNIVSVDAAAADAAPVLIDFDISDLTDIVTDLSDFLQRDEILETSLFQDVYAGELDGYYMVVGSQKVYVPSDRVEYLTRLPSGQLFNLSSSTITMYALDSNGNHGSTFRMPSYGTLQRYDYSGGSYYWTNVSSSDDNLITGQVGLKSPIEVFLLIILFLLFIDIFIKRR